MRKGRNARRVRKGTEALRWVSLAWCLDFALGKAFMGAMALSPLGLEGIR